METDQQQQDGSKGQDGQIDNSRLNDYIKELLREKINLDPSQCPNAMRLLENEVVKTQAKGKPLKETKYVDIYRGKPVRVAVKVLIPVKEHPRFNFVGKLLGPGGNTLKRLQEETMTKMAILGRGSMRDKQKEEDLRNTLDPKYSHLTEELHVEVAALGPLAEAHARIAYALTELRKYLVPDTNEDMAPNQMREMGGGVRGRGRLPPPVPGRAGPPIPPPVAPRPVPPLARPVPPVGKSTKVLSILDRVRQAMEEPMYADYDEPPAYGYDAGGYGNDYGNGGGGDYYEPPSYQAGGGGGGRYKGYKAAPAGRSGGYSGSRSAPYSRSQTGK